jgi:hypothetical protein
LVSRLGLGLLTSLALLIGPAARAESDVHYFKERQFEIPYTSTPDPSFSRVILHVSTDQGKTYTEVGNSLELRGAFTYTAKADGWYFFVVQLQRTDGTFLPTRPERAEPAQRVCIDTQKPKVTLEPAQPDPRYGGTVAVQWSIVDANLDLQTLRLEYRPVGAARWIPLDARQLDRAQYSWSPSSAGPLEVRLTVSDKAKNTTEATAQVRADPSRAGTGRPAAESAVPAGDRQVIYVKRKAFKLTYKIDREGHSGVKHLEVWMTRNTTQWTKFAQVENPTGTVDITAPATGRFGFTLRPVSGVGRGKTPPRAGDLPQIWVEVDETAPKVTLHNVVVNEGDDPSTFTVNWRAEDKFFGEQPITIYYSKSLGPDAKWEVLQANLENTGTCKCKTEGLPYEFYVRVEAVDRAGNKAFDQTRETVKIDLSEPDVKDINVTVSDGAVKPPE